MSQDQYGRHCSYSDCWDPPLFALKIHRRSEPLLGSAMLLCCDRHVGVMWSEYLDDLRDDRDVHAVTVVLA